MNSKTCVPDTHAVTMSSMGIALILLLISGCTDVIIMSREKQHFEIPQYTDEITLTLYTTRGCDFCTQVEAWCEELKREYNDRILIRYVNVTTKGGWEEFRKYGLTITPSVVINGNMLQFDEITRESLRVYIRRAMGVL
ncbi:MAG: glutaredoxin family protein [Theionarchaea archaeon]|nr:glutaredoxin family protein [Theionarchaea archaeon]MBU7020265.1 glutaredoxin family protein [Theionarchaea archaeon]